MLSKEEKQRRKFIRQEVKKKNFSLFYKEFGVNHRAWLKELVKKYKERGKYPLSPLILSDYYEDYGDKLLATLTACLLLDDNRRVMQQVLAVKKLFGEHPYKNLYSNRTFVQWSNGANQTKPVSYFGSVKYWQLAKLFDIVWNIEYDNGKPLFDVFFELITLKEYTPYHALLSLFDGLPVNTPKRRINLALLRLCGTDGISERLWDLGGLESKLECPNDKNVKAFLDIWIPKWNKTFLFNEVCDILGFTKETDVYYCMLAFRELALSKPKDVKEYLKLYSMQLRHGTIGKDGRYQLKNKIPTISFCD